MVRPPLSLKARALACIAQREHSRVELRRKLLEAAARQRRAAEASALAAGTSLAAWPTEPEIDELLDWLAGKDLLSTERFVETRVGVRAARYGNLRIRQELAQHGVELDDQTARQLQASELQRARAVWARRFGAPAEDATGRARQARFLCGRGFSAEVVRRVVSGRGED